MTSALHLSLADNRRFAAYGGRGLAGRSSWRVMNSVAHHFPSSTWRRAGICQQNWALGGATFHAAANFHLHRARRMVIRVGVATLNSIKSLANLKSFWRI